MTAEEINTWHTCEEWEKCIPYNEGVRLAEIHYESRRGKYIVRAVALDRKNRIIHYDHDGKARLFLDKEKRMFARHEEGIPDDNIHLMEYVEAPRYDIKWE